MKKEIRKKVLHCLLASSAMIPVAYAVPAFAQDTALETDDGNRDVVVVTARRREEKLKDVPIAVTSLSAAKLEATGAPDITVLQQVSPNTTMQVARGTNSTLIAFIRGVGQQDPLWGFEPGVGLYVDDVYVARPQGAVLDIFDIERIEVLRGPQGTLYGRNTIGGAVKYVTKGLAHDPTAKARVSVGSYGQMDVVLSGSTPLSDTFRVGGAFASYNRDGFGKNITTGEDHYDKKVVAGRVSAEWQPKENLLFKIAYDKTTDNSNPKHGHREQAGSGLTAGAPVLKNVYDTDAGIKGENKVENEGYSFTAKWDLNDTVSLKYIGAHREGISNTIIDFDTNQAKALDVPALYEDSQDSHEIQAIFNGDKWSGVAGVYYMDAEASGGFDTIVGLLNLTIATSGYVKTKSTAFYGDFSYNFNDALSLSLGGRYTKDEREGHVYRQNFTGLGSPLFGNPTAIPGLLRSNYTNSRDFEEFTPRVSISYKLNQDLTTYAAYSKGFKSGGFDMRGDAILTPTTVNGYDPEYVDSYEIGLKGNLFDNALYIAGAIFSSQYDGQQITRQEPAAGGGIASFVDNAGSSEINGVELEGNWRITPKFSASFGLGYTDAQFNEYLTKNALGQVIDMSSTAKFQNTPEWNGNLTFNYRHTLASNARIDANIGASYRSEYTMFEFANPLLDQTEAYTLIDAGIAYTTSKGHMKASLTGRNLTDERYKVGGYNFAGATYGNVINSFYGPPRTVTATVQFTF